MILSVPSIIKPWCISSVYKMVQLASIAEATIMASNNWKSYRIINFSAWFKTIWVVGTIVQFLNALLHFINVSSFGICKSLLLTFKNSETTCLPSLVLTQLHVSAEAWSSPSRPN